MELMEGVSHSQFASSTTIPEKVKELDLVPTVDIDSAHQMIGQTMAQFFSKVVGGKALETSKVTTDLIAPIIEAME